VVEEADSLIILNQLSFNKFGDMVRDGGLLIYNESLIDPAQDGAYNSNARLLGIPATTLAAEMGNVIVANIIMLGAFVEKTNICKQSAVKSSIENWLSGSRKANLELNMEAFEAGMEMAAPEKR
jgi:2-oxoglutarate ferredoxin oxidoreductase subunit gamma